MCVCVCVCVCMYLQHSGVSEGLGLDQKGQVLHHLSQFVVDGQSDLIGGATGVSPLLTGQ